MCLPVSKSNSGFSLLETMMAVLLIGLMFSAMAVIFRYQAVSTRQNDELSEMNDNLRLAAYWLAKDVKEATSVVQLGEDHSGGKGPGPDHDYSLILKKAKFTKDEEGNIYDVYIYYFYGSNSKPSVFYRISQQVLADLTPPLPHPHGSYYVPITNEYLYGGISKGYLRGWSITCYDNSNNPTTDPAQVRRVEFILKGGYSDKPDDYKVIKTSATIRSGS